MKTRAAVPFATEDERGIIRRGVDRSWLTLRYQDERERWRVKATGLCLPADPVEQRAVFAQARALRDEVERQVARKKRALGLATSLPGVVTVASYALGKWINRRKVQFPTTWQDDLSHLTHHILPIFGERPIAAVETADCVDFVLALQHRDRLAQVKGAGKRKWNSRTGDKLASRTIRNIWATTCALFRDAAALDRLIPMSPCLGVRGLRDVVPGAENKDPTHAARLVLTREQIEQLISDERIPEDRRAIYALDFLSGVRRGESSALLWAAWNPNREPLGELAVVRSYSTRAKLLRMRTKTKVNRHVPVHPTLARVLDHWKRVGWPAHFKRSPGPDDLMFPSIRPARGGTGGGNPRAAQNMNRAFHLDCVLLGIANPPNQHATRHTFITLALQSNVDGPEGRVTPAAEEAIQALTHRKKSKDAFDRYNHLIRWPQWCAAILRIPVGIPAPVLARRPILRRVSGGGTRPETP